MNSYFKPFLLSLVLTLLVLNGYSQARTGIGLSAEINKPFSSHYTSGGGGSLIASIAISPKWAICPYLGAESLNGNNDPLVPGTQPYTVGYKGRYLKAGLIRAGLNAQYFISPKLFVMAGAFPFIALGNEDTIDGNIGGTVAVGVNLPVDKVVRFNFAAFVDVVSIRGGGGNGNTPYAGLKGTIFFDFAKPIFKR